MEKIKVVVVVDMQKDFIDGALGTPEAQKIVPLVAETIHQLADPNTAIIFTKDTHGPTQLDYLNSLEGKNLPVPHCIEGSNGYGIVDPVFIAYTNVMGSIFNVFFPNGSHNLEPQNNPK